MECRSCCARVGGELLVLHARVRNAWSNRTGVTAETKFTLNLRWRIKLTRLCRSAGPRGQIDGSACLLELCIPFVSDSLPGRARELLPVVARRLHWRILGACRLAALVSTRGAGGSCKPFGCLRRASGTFRVAGHLARAGAGRPGARAGRARIARQLFIFKNTY